MLFKGERKTQQRLRVAERSDVTDREEKKNIWSCPKVLGHLVHEPTAMWWLSGRSQRGHSMLGNFCSSSTTEMEQQLLGRARDEQTNSKFQVCVRSKVKCIR